jgi:APA family basic amino acid/polyamine antiporter
METDAVLEKSSSEKSSLLRILGTGFGLAVVVGGSIGVGILRTPGMVAANLGDASLIIAVWVLGGLVALLGANTFSELATMLPEAGGNYVYIRRAYGNFLGFAGGINDFVLNCCGGAYIAITFGEYLGQLFPAFAGRENAVAVAVLVLLTVLNWVGLRAGDIAQQVTSFVKVVAFLVLIAACFAFGGGGPVMRGTAPSSAGPWLLLGAIMLSLQAVMETYAGWNTVVYFAEENKEPGRMIPRSLFGGVIIVMSIYVLVNAALLFALPVEQIAASKLPAADAAQLIFGDFGGKVITVLSLASVLGILNAVVLYTPRIFFAMSRDGFFPIQGANVNAGGTPIVALLLTVALIILFALSGTFETLLAIAAFLGLAGDSFVYLSLFVLRRKEPDLPRPFRAFGYPILPGVVLAAAWIILIGYVASNTANSLISIGILILIYPIYLLSKTVSKHPESDR